MPLSRLIHTLWQMPPAGLAWHAACPQPTLLAPTPSPCVFPSHPHTGTVCTPPGECGYLAANLYAKSVFGEDALVNVSVERTTPLAGPGVSAAAAAAEGGRLAGYIRIRSKTQVGGRGCGRGTGFRGGVLRGAAVSRCAGPCFGVGQVLLGMHRYGAQCGTAVRSSAFLSANYAFQGAK